VPKRVDLGNVASPSASLMTARHTVHLRIRVCVMQRHPASPNAEQSSIHGGLLLLHKVPAHAIAKEADRDRPNVHHTTQQHSCVPVCNVNGSYARLR